MVKRKNAPPNSKDQSNIYIHLGDVKLLKDDQGGIFGKTMVYGII